MRAGVDAFPGSTMIGCSTAGEIVNDGVYDGSLSVAVARFERTSVASEVAPVSQSGPSDVRRIGGTGGLGPGDALAAGVGRRAGLAVTGRQPPSRPPAGPGGAHVRADGLAAAAQTIRGIEELLVAPANLQAREDAQRGASACAAGYEQGKAGIQHQLAQLLGGATRPDHPALHAWSLPRLVA